MTTIRNIEDEYEMYRRDAICKPELMKSYNRWLIEQLIASRDSRTLSAVPSEDEIEKWYIEKYGVARDLNGKPSWNSQSIGYRTDGDLFEMLNDFVEWIKQRGVAG